MQHATVYNGFKKLLKKGIDSISDSMLSLQESIHNLDHYDSSEILQMEQTKKYLEQKIEEKHLANKAYQAKLDWHKKVESTVTL